jgi:hypothetical protein
MLAGKRRKLEQSLCAETTCSKSAIARILLRLQRSGALIDGVLEHDNVKGIRSNLQKAVSDLANRMTPFGPVLQSMMLECTPPLKWEFIHPIALVYMLSQISTEFSDLMRDIISKLNSASPALNILLYIDECRPGNVLRPDKGRALQHILWTFVEFPEWLTVRDQGWFTFGCIRTSAIATLPSHISCLMKHVVHSFLNFGTTGGMVASPTSGPLLFKAKLAGVLGDEKGLKEVFGSKGPGGTKPCLSCKNVCQFLDDVIPAHAGYLVSFKCSDRHRFDKSTDAEVYEIVDELIRIAATNNPDDLKAAEQTHGLHYEPDGLLFDMSLRGIVKPVTGWFRDWMHVMAVSGCANIEIMQIVHALREQGVMPELITNYFAEFVLPKAHGKINAEWFTVRRCGRPSDKRDAWKGFSAEVLSVLPILQDFLDVVIKPTGILGMHIESFRLLDRLMKLFCIGTDTAVKHLAAIEHVIDQHAHHFKAVYPDEQKPKFHHLFHVPDHIRNLNKLCSCFVTERRHRLVKAPATHIFNHFEKTVTLSQLTLVADRVGQENMFSAEYLERPEDVPDEVAKAFLGAAPGLTGPIRISTIAHLLCGTVHKGDIVMTNDRSVGEVQRFLQTSGTNYTVWVFLKLRSRVGRMRHSCTSSESIVVESCEVLAPLTWAKDGDYIRVLPPNVSATW